MDVPAAHAAVTYALRSRDLAAAVVDDVFPRAWEGFKDAFRTGPNKDNDPQAPPPESGLPHEVGGEGMALALGGILPYNGTMKYDAGGYLPPGLTSVVNLTGKPEPVFTNDQWQGMEGKGGSSLTFAPVLNGSDITAKDLVEEFDFTRRKVDREGRYGRNL